MREAYGRIFIVGGLRSLEITHFDGYTFEEIEGLISYFCKEFFGIRFSYSSYKVGTNQKVDYNYAILSRKDVD